MFTREEKLRLKLREFKYMDLHEYSRKDKETMRKAINVLTRHLKMRNLNFHDEEFDCLATALQIKTMGKTMKKPRRRINAWK